MESRETDGLNYERASEILRYCAETGVLERKWKSGGWKIYGAKPNHNGYGRVKVDGKMYLTHHLAWLLTYGELPEHELDHINQNRIDNRIDNLRAATRTENNHNAGLRRDNSSGYPGVSFNERRNKFMARIGANGKEIYLGLYATAEEAFTAYMLAKIKYHPTSPIAQQYLRELTLAG